MNPVTILAVDDNQDALYALERILVHNGYAVVTAASGTEAFKKASEQTPTLVLMDVMMPVMNGFETAEQFKAHPELRFVPIILVTARDALEDVIEGLNRGADDYITKPFQPEELLARVRAALRLKSIYSELELSEKKNEELVRELHSTYDFDNIIGESAEMKSVFSLLEKVADSDSPVLISGPTGSGKELIARAVHYNSNRHRGPFIAKNCAAFPEQLLESELFGHEKGSFTGAIQHKMGLFEAAHRGTLFLDEIGEMAPALQAKLLRVLQDGTFITVGGLEEKHADVRILTATNRNLSEMVENGEFREDLYYRLNVIDIALPRLADRREDIPELVEYFLTRLAAKNELQPMTVTDEALEFLTNYSWKGNIRELQNEIERMYILGREENILGVSHMSARIVEAGSAAARSSSDAGKLKRAVEELEREIILKELKLQNGNKSAAAKELGISRSNLIAKAKSYGLE